MDFTALLYFCTIVEQGQISKAAQKLNISQPPLSQRLKELEEEVGIPLILRSKAKKDWKITEEGCVFYKKAKAILEQFESLRQSPTGSEEEISGIVRIGVCMRCLSFFMELFPKMAMRFQEVSFRLFVGDTPAVQDKLLAREIDMGIMIRPSRCGDCVTLSFKPQKYLAVFSPLIPPPPPAPITVEILCQYPLLVSQRWNVAVGSNYLLDAILRANLKPKIVLDTPASHIFYPLLDQLPVVAAIFEAEIPSSQKMNFPIREIKLNESYSPVLTWIKDEWLSVRVRKILEFITGSLS